MVSGREKNGGKGIERGKEDENHGDEESGKGEAGVQTIEEKQIGWRKRRGVRAMFDVKLGEDGEDGKNGEPHGIRRIKDIRTAYARGIQDVK